MTEQDFITSRIVDFTAKEIEATGCPISVVKLETMQALQLWRIMIDRQVKLQFNGLASGVHQSIYHMKGMAVDVYLTSKDGAVTDFKTMSRYALMALAAGFKGIGMYWNGIMYSYHFDLGVYRTWGASKNPGESEWKYKAFLLDPK